MIEVRSTLTGDLLGYVPGDPANLNTHGSWMVFDLTGALFAGEVERMALQVREHREGQRRWWCLAADPGDARTLRRIRGWKEADSISDAVEALQVIYRFAIAWRNHCLTLEGPGEADDARMRQIRKAEAVLLAAMQKERP